MDGGLSEKFKTKSLEILVRLIPGSHKWDKHIKQEYKRKLYLCLWDLQKQSETEFSFASFLVLRGLCFGPALMSPTSFPGSYLLWRKDPGRSWSRDLLKSNRFLIDDDVESKK